MRVDEGLRCEIVAAVKAIEKASAAEVVVTVVPRSAAYWDVTLGAALAASLLLQAVVGFFLEDIGALQAALDSAVLAILVVGLVRLSVLERLLLPRRMAARRVEAAAESAFCRQGIYRTRAHIGVLVYLSLLERRAIFLPDDGVAHALPAEALASVRTQAAAIFAGPDPRAALLNLLDHLRRLGAQHLAASKDKVNELPDEPVTR